MVVHNCQLVDVFRLIRYPISDGVVLTVLRFESSVPFPYSCSIYFTVSSIEAKRNVVWLGYGLYGTFWFQSSVFCFSSKHAQGL